MKLEYFLLSFWEFAYFQGAFAVSFREGMYFRPFNSAPQNFMYINRRGPRIHGQKNA